MSNYQNWLIAEDSHVATITLHRPQANNSLTPETLSELRVITADLSARDDVWAIIVEGSGDHFSTGIDIGVISEPAGSARKRSSSTTSRNAARSG